jgi:long-chain acyl-CoA synthetase
MKALLGRHGTRYVERTFLRDGLSGEGPNYNQEMTNAIQAQSLSSLVLDRVSARSDAPALHFVRHGETVTRSWTQVGDDIFRLTAALFDLGVQPGDRVIHWSSNRYEWIITDLALYCLGAVHVPVHSTLSARQAADQFLHSEPKLAIVSGDNLLKSLGEFTAELPADLKLVSYDETKTRWPSEITRLSAQTADADSNKGREIADRVAADTDPDAVTTILYSSGTTGQPKGIMLSQRNLLFNATKMAQTFEGEPLEVRLNFLPLSHIFARTCDVYTWLVRGAELALTQSRDTIIDDCKRFRPTVINGVPFFFERVRQRLVEAGKADNPGVLQQLFGGRLRGCFTGGGALADHTYDYYEQQGVPLMQGYGLTESSPVISFSTLETNKRGTAGQALEGIELRLANDGEILTRGPHVMLGYWRDPAATAKTLRNGWLHTGDLGTLDPQGHLRITGRKTEMIVTATGKNVFPGHIEELLCRDPLILQALVVGDRRDCLAALIVPDPDVLKAEIWKRRILVFRRKSAIKHPKVRLLYRDCIDRQLGDLAQHEQIKIFTILDCGFTPESGHMTAKLSLRRSLIQRDYADVIEAMYNR